MYERITSRDDLFKAFCKVKKNKGCAGIDYLTIENFERHSHRHLSELERLLKEDRYQPMPVKRVYIPKPNGKKRPLGIPSVRDRVVQQSIMTKIEPIFEPHFSDRSYGFRPKRNTLQAINKIQEYLDKGYEYIIDADIKDFFGTINQQRLMAFVKMRLPDVKVRRLIYQFLRAGVMEEGDLKTQTTGTPQGGVISPLLANIYLNDFDHKIGGAGLELVRYADDFVILCKTVNQATYAMKLVKQLLASLDLELAPDKTRIAEYKQGFDFLGYHFQKYYGHNYRWPKSKAVESFKEKIRHKTRRQQPKNVKKIIEELNPLIQGWGNYFKHGNSKTRFTRLEGWIRMRLRSFIEKRKWPIGMNWKYPKDHFRKLGLVNLTDLLSRQSRLSFSV